jgi:iron complex transport system substrate-binding protein
MKQRHIIIAILILLLTFALASCQNETTPTSPPPTATEAETVVEPEPEAEAEVPEDVSITVVDALGREVTLPSPPERIIIAGKATTMVVNALYLFPEAQERLVTFESRSQRGFHFYEVLVPQFDEVELLERNAGPEQIAPFKPDLVILKSYMADSLGATLEEIDVPLIYVDLETPEQFERDISILGAALGNPERAQEINTYYNAQLQMIETILENVSEENKPQVLLMQYSDEEGEIAFEVPSIDWIQTEIVTLAGGIPIWSEAAEAGGWTVVGFEQIAAWNPEKIFVINYAEDPTAAVESLKQNPNWMALDAVQQDEIYGFPGDFWSWDQPDPRWILGLTWMATKMNPEIMADIDIRQEVLNFYSQMYGLEPDVVEAEIFPLIQSGLD